MKLGNRRAQVILVVLFVALCAYAPKGFDNSNVITRIALAHAIVAHGTVSIDEVANQTIDKAVYGGHTYCDKAPGLSLLCLPATFVAEAIADGLHAPKLLFEGETPTLRFILSAYFCMLSVPALVSALALIFFRRSLLRAGVNGRAAMMVTLAYGFGTPILIWSTVVFGHALAASFLFFGFAAQWSSRGSPPPSRPALVFTGLAFGLAVLVELTALPAVILLIGYLALARRFSARPLLWIVFGGLAPLLVMLAYNALVFGSPFKIGYGAVQGFEGMRTGLFGIAMPRPRAAFGILFSRYRGILWLSPVLAPAALACVQLARRPGPHRATAILFLLISAYYVCLNSGYAYWDGGYSTGPRHITPVAPFMMFGLGLFWGQASRWFRRIAVATMALSIPVVVTCALVEVAAPSDGRSMLGSHVIPRLLRGDQVLLPMHLGVRFLYAYLLALGAVAGAVYFLIRETRVTASSCGDAPDASHSEWRPACDRSPESG